jgi:hypothetical protein
MEYVSDSAGNYLILDNKDLVDSIRLNDMLYRYLTYTSGKEVLSGYFIQLAGNECKLFMKKPFEYQPERHPQGGYEDYKPAKFVAKPEVFYMKFTDGDLIKIPESSRKIASFFESHGFKNLPDKKIKYTQEELVSLVKAICE